MPVYIQFRYGCLLKGKQLCEPGHSLEIIKIMVCSKKFEKKKYLEYVDARDVAAVSIIFETIPLCSSLYDSYGKKLC